MHIRACTQRQTHQCFTDALNIPINQENSNLQRYLLRNICTHAMILDKTTFIRTLLHRFDFLDQYEQQYGLSQISYFWSIIDANEKGEDYQEDFRQLWSQTPSRQKIRHATLLIELFAQLNWHELRGLHLRLGLEWLEPHQKKFKRGYKIFKQKLAFHRLSYGDVYDGLTDLQSQFANEQNRANQIISKFFEVFRKPSKENTTHYKSLLDELRTLPPDTINRFRGEQMIIPFCFETVEEEELALTDLESIIPFQRHNPDDLRTQIEKMYFDMYLKAERYPQAVDYGQRVLRSSTDMSLHNRHLLQLKVDRCQLYLVPIEESLRHFDTLKKQVQQRDEPTLIEEWQEYTLSLAKLAIKYHSEMNNASEQTLWQERLVEVNRVKLLKTQRLSQQFDLKFRPKPAQRFALDLYRLGLLYDKIHATSKAIDTFQESSDLFESIQGPKRPLYAKQWANALWKLHYRTDTEHNRLGLRKCLELRNQLKQNGVKGLHYALVTVRNTLGTWALRRKEWELAKDHHDICLLLIDGLVRTYPDKRVYVRAQHKIRVRLAWSLYHLGEQERALEIANLIQATNLLTNETLLTHLRKMMADL